MTKPGPLHWSPRPHYRSGLFIDQYRFDGELRPIDFKRGEGFATALNQAGTWCVQSRSLGGDHPLDLTPVEGSIAIQLKWEEEQQQLRRAAGKNRPARIYFGDWVEDLWWLFGAEAARTTFRTSRPLPYDLPPPVGQADWSAYSPQAALVASDGTETPQTVVTSGTPSAGEVMIPDTGGGQYETVTTPAVSTLGGAEYLAVYYPAVYIAVVALAWDYPVPNGLDCGVSLRELTAGTYQGHA